MALLATSMTLEHARRLLETLREEPLYRSLSEALVSNNRYEEIDLTYLEFQVNTNFDHYNLNVRISWRLRNLRGEFYLSEEVLCQTRNIEQFIRDRIRKEAVRCLRLPSQAERNLQPQQFPPDDCILRREIFLNDGPLNSLYQTPTGPTPQAEQKAKELLLNFLTPRQRDVFTQKCFFDVFVPERFDQYSGTYRLSSARAYNIRHLESGNKFCAVPENAITIPLGDILLAQKLMLEADPVKFLKKANKRDIEANRYFYGDLLGRITIPPL